ncbi:Actin-related protein 2/3 complex subunit 5 [Zancudomyces culisetae]|uniref:Actin-related protein 2/3 complex subunit 5 n=1 Tax=Zancudomyces culisetae TaxID=1213189 RepID=A0A1R1PJQ7_ZANCU|nr:Actin-related protein 2/3 complex subunit 5 [Zancudomyces culisetae]OMH86046.1 Actin-related protein 2/3 complex subunit 5 [Zancudomyces culisetae]|eukprot:OMH81201.1 Actin-related protein 2/3 complex subunit 5 [Zancudomyces culisetae]
MSFRKLDVSTITEEKQILLDRITQVNTEPGANEEAERKFQSKSSQVRAFITKGNALEALAQAISEPPYGLKDSSIPDKSAQLVMDVLASSRSQDAVSIIGDLAENQRVVLLKYIYYMMARPAYFNCSMLLSWHEKIVQVSGIGSICRVLSDRHTL